MAAVASAIGKAATLRGSLGGVVLRLRGEVQIGGGNWCTGSKVVKCPRELLPARGPSIRGCSNPRAAQRLRGRTSIVGGVHNQRQADRQAF
jgi:hypothetical protein